MLTFSAYGWAFAVEGTDEAAFVEGVVADANAFWARQFELLGYPYMPAGLEFVYDEPVSSGCGPIYSYEGPLYCQFDGTLYYPLNWTLPSGRPLEQYGYSAVAMAIAHEVGHHAQKQMDDFGIRSLDNWTETGHELQADCFAGVWAKQANEQIEDGGTEAILSVLLGLGGPIHGTYQQRIAAFELGYYSGDLAQCLALTA